MELFDQAVRKPLLSYVPAWIHPNHLSILRALCLGPLLAVGAKPEAIAIVVFSALCDMLDGPLARNRGQVSQNGAILDATSDKVFLLGAIILVCRDNIWPLLWITITALDLLLTIGRPIKRWLGAPTDANQWGGLKVWAQTFGVCFALAQTPWGEFLTPIAFSFAIAFAVLSLIGHLSDILGRARP